MQSFSERMYAIPGDPPIKSHWNQLSQDKFSTCITSLSDMEIPMANDWVTGGNRINQRHHGEVIANVGVTLYCLLNIVLRHRS